MGNRKNYYKIGLVIVLIYFALLCLLYISEVPNPESNIQTFGDVVWYSVVTLTTVGYGDLTPVTTAGHLVGGIFLLLSMGLLVTLFSTAVSFLTGEALPMLFLRFQRTKNWYYFCDFGPESDLMARDVIHNDKDAVIIFGEQKDKEMEVPDYPCYFLNDVPHRVVELKKDMGSQVKVFVMRENDIYRNIKAVDIDRLPVEIYANTTNGQERISEKMHFFHSYDCCARQYWMDHLLRRDEKCIVIIGFGYFGDAILERAIMMNVIAPDQHVEYHIFGDATRFLQVHSKLSNVFSMNEKATDRDMLFFHESTWRNEYELMARADRIIICDDEEVNSWDILWKLKRYYVVNGELHIRSNQKVPDIECFGSAEDIYTCENILKTVQNHAAIVLNNQYKRMNPKNFIEWDDLDDLLKLSKIAVADHLIMKCRILLWDDELSELNKRNCENAYEKYSHLRCNAELRENYRAIEHLRWLRYYSFYNWTYGPVADDRLREHPMMVPYEELTHEQKRSRDYSWELLHTIRDLL